MNFGNLHAIASALIPQQQITLTRFKGVTTNAMGYQIAEYHDPETIAGSLQPMAAQDATKLGLDFRQMHATLHTSAKLSLSGAGTQPDKLAYGGRNYEVIGVTDWSAQDGWASYVLVVV